MKKVLMAICILTATLSFSSCKKGCYICTRGLDEFDICEEDFEDADKPQKAFSAELKYYEAYGYKCKKD